MKISRDIIFDKICESCISPKQNAIGAGIPEKSLYRIINSETETVEVHLLTLAKLAKFFSVPVRDLQ